MNLFASWKIEVDGAAGTARQADGDAAPKTARPLTGASPRLRLDKPLPVASQQNQRATEIQRHTSKRRPSEDPWTDENRQPGPSERYSNELQEQMLHPVEAASENTLSLKQLGDTLVRPPLQQLSAVGQPSVGQPSVGQPSVGQPSVGQPSVLPKAQLPGLHITLPEASVQAVADYSLDYGKHVFYGVISAARKWQADDAGAMAAGVAYYLALSLFPMLLLLTAGLGLIFRFTSVGKDAEMQILAIVAEHCSPTLEQQVRQVLAQLQEHSLVGGPFGLLTAVLAAIGVFYQFERAFDRIWKVKSREDADWWSACKRIITRRISAFFMLASVGLAIVVILLINVAVGFVQAWMVGLHIPGSGAISAVDACVTLLLNAAVFGLLYRWLPKRRIQWTDALRGGLLAAIVWEVGRQLLGAVLIGVKYTAAYGAIGSFIALLLWCYWGVSIIFFGAEYAQVLSDYRRQANEPPPIAPHQEPLTVRADISN